MAGTGPLAAQAVAPGVDTIAGEADPGDIRGQARSAQARFERRRSRLFPRRFGASSGPCDEVVGRFCTWYDEGEWAPEPEDPGIAPFREALLAELDSLQRLAPADDWILGQRVWYRTEGGDPEGALALARECGPPQELWWCAALEGFVLYALARHEEAERAFSVALFEMDVERAWRWRVPLRAVDIEARRVLEALRTAPVDSVQHVLGRLWALADPLYLLPGNDRRTAHFARWAVATMREGSRTPYGIRWGSDIEELLVRHGWELGWELERDPRFPGTADQVVGHKHPEGRDYMPSGAFLLAPEAADPDATVAGHVRPRSLYAPHYAPVVLPLDAQIARFPRGPSLVVVGTHQLPADTSRHATHDHPRPWMKSGDHAGLPDRSGLYLVDARSGEPVAAAEADTGSGALIVSTGAGRYLLSVETWSPARRLAGRLRMGIEHVPVPEGVPVLSDLLLVRARAEAPDSAEDLATVASRALPGTTVPEGTRLGVAWEVSGLGFAQETLDFELSVERRDRGVFRRIGGFLGLAGPDRPLALAWQEAGPEAPGPMLRVVDLELPDLEPGEYRIALTLRAPGREAISSVREFRVRG